MDHKKLQATAQNIKTEEDLIEFQQTLTKLMVEAALNAELDDRLPLEPAAIFMPNAN